MTEKLQQINQAPDPHQNERDLQDKEIQNTLGRIKHKILVMSGKGGVGKSTVAVNLALNLADKGYKVGLMDVDLHGPSVPRILGLEATFPGGDKPRPIPYSPYLAVISIEPLLPDKDKSVIWRGPLKIGVIRQFIADIEWDELDYLIIDSPPGTGDEPLTVAQTISDAHALLVTTPQELAVADVRKSLDFCRQVNMPILGVVENMSGMTCPHCGEKIEFLMSGGGLKMAKNFGVTFLGQIPFDPQIVQASENGKTFMKPYKEMTDAVLARIEI
ncbi:MAG: Mrp/NBP35 family ATP-binding protein [Deltaproteobacteria bacterium]|nr:Mrp/NBP35 family ATP-binding protein [Deltaproteobacteria bacterium]MBW2139760.1 Mrp/NBP35 family ATP-binding protein [Deltaproteobacteria bacterium]